MNVRADALAIPTAEVPAPPPRLLSLEIKIATQTQHSALNRLITNRLNLCLPPHTRTPQLYAIGLSVFGTIYACFETEWQLFLGREELHTSRTADILKRMHIPEMLRTEKLKCEMDSMKSFIDMKKMPDSASDMIQTHESTIRASIRAKPHVAMAYMWVMYMALFNGGRIIRDTLAAAGPDFWQVLKPSSLTDLDGDDDGVHHLILHERLHFWSFDSLNDGDNIKEDFKTRFDEIAAAQLKAAERADVVDEAVRIFAMCADMVDWLDANVGTTGQDTEKEHSKEEERALQQHSNSWYERLVMSDLYAVALAIWDILLSIYYYFFDGPRLPETRDKSTRTRESNANLHKRF